MNAKKTALNKERLRDRSSKCSTRTILNLALICFQLGVSYAALGDARAQSNEEITQEESVRLRNFSRLNRQEVLDEAGKRTRELVSHALQFSPNVREAGYTAAAAEQDIGVAKSAKLPQIFASGQSLMTTGDIAQSSKATGKPSLTLSAQMPVYDWGRIEANIKGRESALTGAIARAALIERQTAADAILNCLELNKSRALLASNTEYLLKIKSFVDMLTKVVEADPGRAAEQVQAKSRLLQAVSTDETMRSKVQEVRIRLERILGQDQAKLCEGVGLNFLAKPDIEQIATNLKQHPQIIQLEAETQQLQKNIDQISASRKPQVLLRGEHAPVSASLTNDYQQSLSVVISAPLYDGRSLESQERAAIERVSSADERATYALKQLNTDLRERYKAAVSNLRRAEEYVGLLEINNKVREDFFLQWAALGRRSLFELLAIEAEQYSLQLGYFTALYDGLSGIAYVSSQAGLVTEKDPRK